MNFAIIKRGVSIVATSLVLAAGLPSAASAAPISFGSELAFFGGFEATGGTDLASATGMSFSGPTDILAGTGDFAFATGDSATFAAFDFSPPALGTILTFANGGAFTASSVTVESQSATELDLIFTGNWSLDGFDDTAGGLTITANSLGGIAGVFSATGSVAVIPVPGALLLLGSALIGMGAVRRKA